MSLRPTLPNCLLHVWILQIYQVVRIGRFSRLSRVFQTESWIFKPAALFGGLYVHSSIFRFLSKPFETRDPIHQIYSSYHSSRGRTNATILLNVEASTILKKYGVVCLKQLTTLTRCLIARQESARTYTIAGLFCCTFIVQDDSKSKERAHQHHHRLVFVSPRRRKRKNQEGEG